MQVQLNCVTNALFLGIAQALALLTCVCYADENRKELRRIVMVGLLFEIAVSLTIGVLLWFAPHILLERFFLGNNTDAYIISGIAISYFGIGLMGNGLALLFANYLQAIGRSIMSEVVYVLADVALIWFVVSHRLENLTYSGMSDIIMMGATFSGVAKAQLSMILVIPVLIILVNLFSKRRPDSGWDFFMMLPKGFGVSQDRELTASLSSMEEVVAFSQQVHDFCMRHGIPARQAFHMSLTVEEMAGNVIEHGFTERKNERLEARLVVGESDLILRMRDNCKAFDPKKYYESAHDSNDPTSNVGLKIVLKLATEVSYTSTLKLNNLIVRIPREAN